MDSRQSMNDVPWTPMTPDEYAEYARVVGGRSLRQAGNVWWCRVRPFFFRPLNLFEDLPEDISIPWAGALVGGVQYPVRPADRANTQINLLACDDAAAYSLTALNGSLRSQIRKGLRTFDYRRITDPEMLAVQGHPVYLEFLDRTQYGHHSSRENPSEFSRWARSVFAFPKVRVVGAFYEDRIAAVTLSFLVQDVLHYSMYFGNQFALANRASDGMLHTIRESAAGDPRIRVVFSAVAGMPRGLDRFYMLRGFKIVPRPARFRGNPLALAVLKHLAPDQHRKLRGEALPPERRDGDRAQETVDAP